MITVCRKEIELASEDANNSPLTILFSYQSLQITHLKFPDIN